MYSCYSCYSIIECYDFFFSQVEYKHSVLFICSQATRYFLRFGGVELSFCVAVIVVTLS